MVQAAEALFAQAGVGDEPFCGVLIRWQAEEGHAFEMPQGELPLILWETGCLYGRAVSGGGLFLLVFNPFPAASVRSARCWLYMRYLLEKLPGAMEVSGEFFSRQEAVQALESFRPLSDWWNASMQLSPAQARLHRKQLQTGLKKNQLKAIPGYVSRMVNTRSLTVGEAWAFVPLLMEAVWTQYPNVSLEELVNGLVGSQMAVHPDTALIAWSSQVSQTLRNDPQESKQAPIDRAIAGILADCSLPYTQSNLAKSLGLTPAYFCRLFKEQTGCHFSQYLTRVRMEKAKELLARQGEMNLAETAQRCGYPHKSYFCQVFKKHTGMSPGEYHQSQQDQ